MNDLFELEKEKALKDAKISSLKRRIELLEIKQEPGGVDYSKERVQSSHLNDSQLEIIAKIVEMEKDIAFIQKELEVVNKDINEQYQIFKKFNDEEQQIYIEKRIFKWSNAKISVKHNGISKRQINRVISKIKRNLIKNR